MSDVVFDTVLQQVQKLSVVQRLRLMELVAASLQSDVAHQPDWHTALRATYGILADDPIERPPQLPVKNEAVDAFGWPIGFFEETYGSFADDPLDRGDTS